VKQSNQQNNVAFVLGNGTSRRSLNHNNLLDKGIVYACNAMYREFEPHYLIAVDVKMVNEIVASGYNKTHAVWTNPNKGISTKHHLNLFNPHKGWSSGPTALWFASDQLGIQVKNIKHITYDEFNSRFPGCTYTAETVQKTTI